MKKYLIFAIVLFMVLFVSCEKSRGLEREKEAHENVIDYYWNTYGARLSNINIITRGKNSWLFEGTQTRSNGNLTRFSCTISYYNGDWYIGYHY